jgi:hypothetical protein
VWQTSRFVKLDTMCRSIKTLRRKESKPTDQEIHDAALQFVRKISGYRVPSRANTAAFESAVKEVSTSSRRLLDAVA